MQSGIDDSLYFFMHDLLLVARGIMIFNGLLQGEGLRVTVGADLSLMYFLNFSTRN